jgi:hypothetical protein
VMDKDNHDIWRQFNESRSGTNRLENSKSRSEAPYFNQNLHRSNNDANSSVIDGCGCTLRLPHPAAATKFKSNEFEGIQ